MKSGSENCVVSPSRGWVVLSSAVGVAIVLGILYIWSIVKGAMPDAWGWTNADKSLPFSLFGAAFAITMVPAGRLQDKFGPRMVTFLGSFLCGLGLIICGLGGSSKLVYAIGFGCITGCGVGFGYSALTPAAVKWFPPERTGFITGLVVAGFGVSSAVLAPLAAWFLKIFQSVDEAGVVVTGVPKTMIAFGILTWGVAAILVPLIKNPPEGFIGLKHAGKDSGVVRDFTVRAMLKTPQFWLFYVMFFCGGGAGLTFVSVAQDLGKKSLGEWAFLAVIVLSAGNTIGRIVSGSLSDRIGRQMTLLSAFICQWFMVAFLYYLTHHGGGTWPILLPVIFLLGANYGANLTLFPSASKDYFGIRNFGLNYGCLFTAYGASGLILPWVNGKIRDVTGSSDLTYMIILGLMALSAILAIVSHKAGTPKEAPALR